MLYAHNTHTQFIHTKYVHELCAYFQKRRFHLVVNGFHLVVNIHCINALDLVANKGIRA